MLKFSGRNYDAIQQAEDRDQFRSLMNELNEPVPESDIVHSLEEAYRICEKLVIR